MLATEKMQKGQKKDGPGDPSRAVCFCGLPSWGAGCGLVMACRVAFPAESAILFVSGGSLRRVLGSSIERSTRCVERSYLHPVAMIAA